jgi:hypothetical protein
MILSIYGVTVQLRTPKSVPIIHDRLYKLTVAQKEAIIKYLMDEGFIAKGSTNYLTKNHL